MSIAGKYYLRSILPFKMSQFSSSFPGNFQVLLAEHRQWKPGPYWGSLAAHAARRTLAMATCQRCETLLIVSEVGVVQKHQLFGFYWLIRTGGGLFMREFCLFDCLLCQHKSNKTFLSQTESFQWLSSLFVYAHVLQLYAMVGCTVFFPCLSGPPVNLKAYVRRKGDYLEDAEAEKLEVRQSSACSKASYFNTSRLADGCKGISTKSDYSTGACQQGLARSW